MSDKQKNVLGQDLEQCSLDPLTGWYRDGCCNTDENDHGVHTVCAKVTDEFLEWCKEAGNDLITPHPEFGFPGLKNGDGWCVCASWYAKAVEAGKGCPIYLKSTHQNTLKILPVVYLILILALILPGFLYANKNRKIFFNNLFIWTIIIGIIIILIKFLTN